MTSLMTKSSLYDMMSMIIPGFLFIVCVEIASGIGFDRNFYDLTASIITFVLSYILGLIIHLVSKILFNPLLRNDFDNIKQIENDVQKRIKEESELKIYYEKYYKLIGDYPKSVVPMLEAQVAFLRSMMVIIPAAIFSLAVAYVAPCNKGCCCVNSLLFLYGILMFIVCFLLFVVEQCCKDKCWIFTWVGAIIFASPLSIFFIARDNEFYATDLFPISNDCLIIYLFILEIVLYFITNKRQKDIYFRIFEDDNYIK